ncbi:MAG TPA: CdaR family protein [Polyangiales bacterium]
MTAEATLTQRLRRMLLENVGLKLFSLVVSIGLFTVVHGSATGQRSLFVPVVAVLPTEASGKVLVGEIPDTVKVTLSGSQSVLNSIDRVDAVQVDVSDAPRYYRFEPQAFRLPAGIDVDVTPPVLTLDWESRAEQRINVRAHFSGMLDPALELEEGVSVSPKSIAVRGPRSKIEALREAPTEAIVLGELGPGTHRKRVALLPLPKHVVTKDATDVMVEFKVEARKEQRRLRKLAVAVLGVEDSVVIRPQHVDVVIAAPERTLAELDPDHVVPTVDLSGKSLGNGVISAPVTLRGVDTVRVLRIEPSEVLVRGGGK